MIERLFAVMLALLVANPICCCQDLSSLWSSVDTETSCGCQQSSDEKTPDEEPCSGCASKMHKASPNSSTGLPSVQVHDLQIQPRALISHEVAALSSNMVHAATAPLRHIGKKSFQAAYCVFRL